MRFIDFKNILRDQIWAAGEAENLVKQHDNLFLEAMSELQKWVPFERELNVDVVPFNSTWYKGGLTVVPKGVSGRVKSVYTIGNCQWTDPVWYHQADEMEPQKWAHNLEIYSKGKENEGWPKLPLGFRAADASTDRVSHHNNATNSDPAPSPRLAGDGQTVIIPTPNEIVGTPGDPTLARSRRWRRAQRGIWSWCNRDIHIAPWINSNEMVVIEWEGIKKQWADNDLVSEEIDVAKFVKLYVQYAHERDFGEKSEMAAFDTLQKNALADIIWERKQRTRRTRTDEMEWRNRFAHELSESGRHWDDDDDTTPTPTFHSHPVIVTHGIGSPQGTVMGRKGDIYIDDVSGAFYWNGNGKIDGWKP